MFDPSFYLKLVDGCGITSKTERDLPPGLRIVKRIEDALGHEFDHYDPALHLLSHQHDLVDSIDEATLDRFEQLFVRVNEALK